MSEGQAIEVKELTISEALKQRIEELRRLGRVLVRANMETTGNATQNEPYRFHVTASELEVGVVGYCVRGEHRQAKDFFYFDVIANGKLADVSVLTQEVREFCDWLCQVETEKLREKLAAEAEAAQADSNLELATA